MKDIVVRFPGVLANDHVNFTLKQGKIHALLGENRGRQSTLMNVLAGLYRPTSGYIECMVNPLTFPRPKKPSLTALVWYINTSCWYKHKLSTENILLGLDTPPLFLKLGPIRPGSLGLAGEVWFACRPHR